MKKFLFAQKLKPCAVDGRVATPLALGQTETSLGGRGVDGDMGDEERMGGGGIMSR